MMIGYASIKKYIYIALPAINHFEKKKIDNISTDKGTMPVLRASTQQGIRINNMFLFF